MSNYLHEITPISDKDCFYIVERHKSEFLFPRHAHAEYELNFIENGKGVRRVVGDSVETIDSFELTLITGQQLEHAWEQGNRTGGDMREITIQFSPDIFTPELLKKSQFASIREMLEKAEHGLTFSMKTIMKVYPLIDTIASENESFDQFLHFMKIMYELSLADDSRVLASRSSAPPKDDAEGRRVLAVKQYINAHHNEDLRLETLAALAGMSPSAFSRFFRQRTGRTLMDYIIDVRLGYAARKLIDTTSSISEISAACGFNNLSNFNRIFKARRSCTPREFREMFKKKRVIV